MRKLFIGAIAATVLAGTAVIASRDMDAGGSTPPLDMEKGRLCIPVSTRPVLLSKECLDALEAGERNAILAAAFYSLAHRPGEAEVAGHLARLQSLADKQDGVAAYYLGARYVQGDYVPRDFARGRALLETAVSRGGDIRALDLLGYLLIEGLGGPPDVERGLALLRKASEAGLAAAAVHLAEFYIEGRRVDRDRAAARQALNRYAGQGIAEVESKIEWLDMMERMESVATNVVSIPKPDGSPPDVLTVPTSQLPRLPRSIGFNTDLEALWRRPYSDNDTIVPDLKARLADLPTPYIYELVRRLRMENPADARAYFLLAVMRTSYDMDRCTDRTSSSDVLPLWVDYSIGSLDFIGRRPADELRLALQQALQLEAGLPADTRPWWQCFHGMSYVAAAGGPKAATRPWMTPRQEWKLAREGGRNAVKALVDDIISRQVPPRR